MEDEPDEESVPIADGVDDLALKATELADANLPVGNTHDDVDALSSPITACCYRYYLKIPLLCIKRMSPKVIRVASNIIIKQKGVVHYVNTSNPNHLLI